MSAVSTVETALDRYVARRKARGVDPEGFRARTLAALAKLPVGHMSDLLQQYRWVQRAEGATRYVVACQGYGRAARWLILAKPGSDPKVVRQARRDQALWIARDGLARIMRDTFHEVLPGLKGTALDRAIEDETEALIDHVGVSVKRLERVLTR